MSQNWTPPPAGGSTPIANNLVIAIISVICCLPLGIPAIIFAYSGKQLRLPLEISQARRSQRRKPRSLRSSELLFGPCVLCSTSCLPWYSALAEHLWAAVAELPFSVRH